MNAALFSQLTDCLPTQLSRVHSPPPFHRCDWAPTFLDFRFFLEVFHFPQLAVVKSWLIGFYLCPSPLPFHFHELSLPHPFHPFTRARTQFSQPGRRGRHEVLE